ncbi:hypothetical protein FS842_004285 [Serendipita sp. 407]|nr:hypothetical protein FS842_004285 [Serendipita sp. 407]
MVFANVALSLILMSSVGVMQIMTQGCNAASIPARRALTTVEDGDASIRIVEIIECTPLAGATGRLVMKNTPTDENSASAGSGSTLLPAEGVPLGLVNQQLVELSSSEDSQEFFFTNCTSGFMNETPSGNVYFGHLVLASDSNPCLISTPGAETAQDITTEQCRISDDSGQMLQFWKLTFSEDGTLPASLDFVGISTRVDSSLFYDTVFEGVEGNRVAKILKSNDDAASYEINLVSN